MSTKPLRVVLVEPPVSGTLAPLLEDRPFALLPMGNRPLAAHTLAAFAEAGIREVEILTERFAARLPDALGDGSRWGLSLRYRAVADCGAAWDSVVADAAEDSDLLAWRLDVVPEPDDVRAVLAAPAACLLECFGLEPDALPVRLRRAVAPQPRARVRLAHVLLLREAATFWRANVRALRIHTSRHHVERRIGRSAFVDALAVVHESAVLEEPCMIGAHARVAAQARIGRDSVVGEDVLVGEGVSIVESVVLPGTLLGPHLQLHRKIVDGPMIIDVENGTVVYIADRRIIGRLGAAPVARVPASDRLLAATTALVVLPAAGLFCAGRILRRRAALRRDELPQTVTRTLDGSTLTAATTRWSLATTHDGWARAPWLVGVARGRWPLAQSCTGEEEAAWAMLEVHPDEQPTLGPRCRALGRWLRSLLRSASSMATAADAEARIAKRGSHAAPAC